MPRLVRPCVLLSAFMYLLDMELKDIFIGECLVTNVARYGHCFLRMKGFDVGCHSCLCLESTATLGTLVLRLLVYLHVPRQVRACVERVRALVAPTANEWLA